jgi:hypothetical protein
VRNVDDFVRVGEKQRVFREGLRGVHCVISRVVVNAGRSVAVTWGTAARGFHHPDKRYRIGIVPWSDSERSRLGSFAKLTQ